MAHKNTSNVSPYTTKKKGPLRGRHKKPVKIFTHQEANDRLLDIFRNHGFEWVDHETREQFVRFYRLLLKTQNKQNFTRLLSIRDIGIKHFIDSMILAQMTELQYPLLDMGTGPGFPGIPLRIITDTKHKIILSEGVQKRVAFLKDVREELKLDNLDIIGRNVNSDFHYPVMGVVTRAVEDARNTLKNVVNCLQTGGRVYLMKGPNVGAEVSMALKDWGQYYKLVQDDAYALPSTPHQRRLLVFEKTGHPTDTTFNEDDNGHK